MAKRSERARRCRQVQLRLIRMGTLPIQVDSYAASDRARYGVQLYHALAEGLARQVDVGYTPRYLRLCRQFYEVYPQIGKSLNSKSEALPPTAKSLVSHSSSALPGDSADGSGSGIVPDSLLTSLSFTHFVELMTESRLEHFLLELGRGFCFEARQRRVLIGGEHFFVDLVFYHRILECHVLLELKSAGFSHEYLGQLNTYVSWYREHEMTPGDNPPIGILLCTERNHALVKYGLAGMNSQLFVSKYQLQLPDESEMRAFVEAQLQA